MWRGLIIALLVSVNLWAADPWKQKSYKDWDAADLHRILSDSPWARRVVVEHEGAGGLKAPEGAPTVKGSPSAVEDEEDEQGGRSQGPDEDEEHEKKSESPFIVRWISSRTLHRAGAVGRVLKGQVPPNEGGLFPGTYDVIAQAPGFAMGKRTVDLEAPTNPVVNFKLAVSSAQASFVDKQPPAQTELKLKFAVIVTRHGVRSPIRNVEELEAYSEAPWPAWDVAPGDLTPNGRKLMVMFGSYYRAYFAHNGLLSTTGCGDANSIHIRADVDARTQDTGRALASGMMPGCSIDVHVSSIRKDPLFSPLAAGIGTPDRALAVASIAGRIGGNPDAVVASHRQAFDTLRQVLFGCMPIVPCAAEEQRGKKAILREPSSLGATEHGHMADIYGPLKVGASLSESLQLEYANGMTGERLGWGRLTIAKLMDIMTLHAVYADLVRQTPYIARIQASNLLSHIVSSMQQAVDNAPARGSLGKVGDRLLVIVGHDTNLSNIAGTLGISWLLNGYQLDDTPPGGALVFELWQDMNGEFRVRTYFTAQSLEQMRSVISISLQSPPLTSPIFIPGCSGPDQHMACTWKGFQRTVESALDPEFAKP